MILPGAEPFLLPGGPEGVLLIHGFTGLPAELLLMGKYLQERGFTVLGVRLAGHGTTAEDMSHMTDEDWMDSVRDGYAVLAGCTESISVVGHSMGGLFALLLAAEEQVSRIVTLAAPIVIAKERGIQFLPPREISEGLFVPKARRKIKGVPPVVNHTYRKMPLISVHEMLDAIETVKVHLSEVRVPALIVHSRQDHTAAPESAEYIYEHISSEEKEIYWLEDMGHLLPIEEGRELVFERVAAFLQKGLQET
ncbi:MAG: alpha/beta fold hydrolase [Selenomonadaceae bacterium]|nr:alpha/beta fold hydrolase [Selenomonadaceae bacterium]MBQ1914817.1 alpha/beta fold hydrolase [Selenomonadaceae bacterium]MBQ3971401.1 alpha/beta fold hydrolase [Selenomonadaceae bacterium]